MTIYVGNLPHEVTQDDLSNACTEYGTIKRVQLPTAIGLLSRFCSLQLKTEGT